MKRRAILKAALLPFVGAFGEFRPTGQRMWIDNASFVAPWHFVETGRAKTVTLQGKTRITTYGILFGTLKEKDWHVHTMGTWLVYPERGYRRISCGFTYNPGGDSAVAIDCVFVDELIT
jgi:hypothetical protein